MQRRFFPRWGRSKGFDPGELKVVNQCQAQRKGQAERRAEGVGGTEFCWGGLRMESWASRWAPKHPPTPLSRGPRFNIGAVL